MQRDDKTITHDGVNMPQPTPLKAVTFLLSGDAYDRMIDQGGLMSPLLVEGDQVAIRPAAGDYHTENLIISVDNGDMVTFNVECLVMDADSQCLRSIIDEYSTVMNPVEMGDVPDAEESDEDEEDDDSHSEYDGNEDDDEDNDNIFDEDEDEE